MNKFMLIFTVLLFCWSCDVPGNVVDTELGAADVQSRKLYDNNEGEDDDPGDQAYDPMDDGDGNGGGTPVEPNLATTNNPIFFGSSTIFPSVRVQLFRDKYYGDPLIVEMRYSWTSETDNMIYGFEKLPATTQFQSPTAEDWGLTDLNDLRFNDQTSSIKIYNDSIYPIKVIFYKDKNCDRDGKQFSKIFNPKESKGWSNLSKINANSLFFSWNEDISSIRIIYYK
ncbi:MAG: hypothetical protein GY756_13455 [bacterium]|nr:hypothetical protein [bacterium]